MTPMKIYLFSLHHQKKKNDEKSSENSIVGSLIKTLFFLSIFKKFIMEVWRDLDKVIAWGAHKKILFIAQQVT